MRRPNLLKLNREKMAAMTIPLDPNELRAAMSMSEDRLFTMLARYDRRRELGLDPMEPPGRGERHAEGFFGKKIGAQTQEGSEERGRRIFASLIPSIKQALCQQWRACEETKKYDDEAALAMAIGDVLVTVLTAA